MKNLGYYFLTDFKRFFMGGTWIAASIGIVCSMFFSLEGGQLIDGCALDAYVNAMTMNGEILIFVCCAFAFAGTIGEDLERKYIRYQVIRGNLKSYLFARSSMIFMSSVMVMMAGAFIFIILLRIKFPWESAEAGMRSILKEGNYEELLDGKHYLSYCMLYALHNGLIAGILSNFAALCSTFIVNKVLVLVSPMLLWMVSYAVPSFYGLNSLRAEQFMVFTQDWLNLLSAAAIAAGLSIVFTVGSYKRLQRRI